VRRATGSADLEPVEFETERLSDGADNPTSDGVFRLSAKNAGSGHNWSVVVKYLLRPPRDLGSTGRPSHAVYWRREIEAYLSPLLDRLPGDVVAPQCFVIDESQGDRASLWLEDVGPAVGSAVTGAERRSVLGHLARFHAAYLTDEPLPDFPWLTKCFARRWHEFMYPLADDGLTEVRRSARHLTSMAAVVDEPWALLEALESAPQTLCHHDARADHLLVRSRRSGGTELVAVDWQLVGHGPVGEDVGQFLSTIIATTEPGARDRVESEALAAYHVALVSAGVGMTLRDVHRGYYCSAAVRQVTDAFGRLGRSLRSARSHDARRRLAEDFVRATRHSHLPALAARARVLAEA
jgi:hypothetical protein